jgi:hypothetical protein
VPQIEVTFDKTMHRQRLGQGSRTGKEQKITITSSSGLSKDG